jgi:tocopherol cyclase
MPNPMTIQDDQTGQDRTRPEFSGPTALSAAGHRLIATYRRTGADVPFGDPVPWHAGEMEGWFWRLTDSASGRVVVALCSVNQHPDGDWATVAVALHPGGILRTAVLDGARASQSRFALSAGTTPQNAVTADVDRLRIDLDDTHLELRLANSYAWPKAFAGGGLSSSIPWLNQYWHPYRLGGTATGTVECGGERWSFEAAKLYAEKNWGPGFPERWWWGQAHDFGGADVSVSFTGGLVQLGPIRRDAGLVVVRLGDRVIRIAPPAQVRSQVGSGRWTVRAKSLRYQIDLDGDGTGLEPYDLPVPLPAERRNVGAAVEHLAGRLHCVVRDFGRVVFEGTSELAGLEVGRLPAHS